MAAALIGLLLAAGCQASKEQPQAGAHPGTTGPGVIPPDLAFAAPDSGVFLRLKVDTLWNSEAGKALRAQFPKEAAQFESGVESDCGVKLADIRCVTAIARPAARKDGPLSMHDGVIITLAQPIDREKVLRARLQPAFASVADSLTGSKAPAARKIEFQEHTHHGKSYFTRKLDPQLTASYLDAVHFINDRVYLSGSQTAVQYFLENPVRADAQGPLSTALRLADRHQFIVAAVSNQTLREEIEKQPLGQMPMLKAFLAMQSGVVTLDLGADTRLGARINFADAAGAKAGLEAAQGGLAMVQQMVSPEMLAELDKQNKAPKAIELVKRLLAALPATKLEQHGAALEIGLRVPADAVFLSSAVMEGIITFGARTTTTFDQVGEAIGEPRPQPAGEQSPTPASEAPR
jgi:hypothetical protein